MYCRECGNQILNTALKCPNCNTQKGEGVSYCYNCGSSTSFKADFFFNCGAKLKNIMTQKMKNLRLAELQKKAKFNKTMMKIEKFIAIAGIVAAIICIAVLILRPEPANIPDPSDMYISPNAYIHDNIRRIGNTYYFSSDISEEVVEYWIQGRALISYIIFGFFMSVFSFIVFLIQKSVYKKIMKAIWEVKNVL